MRPRRASNVDIGTTAPASALDVLANVTHPTAIATFEGNGNDANIQLKNNGTGGRTFEFISSSRSSGVPSSLRLWDATAGADRLVVGSGGNVGIGIGTTFAASRLNIGSGSLCINGTHLGIRG